MRCVRARSGRLAQLLDQDGPLAAHPMPELIGEQPEGVPAIPCWAILVKGQETLCLPERPLHRADARGWHAARQLHEIRLAAWARQIALGQSQP